MLKPFRIRTGKGARVFCPAPASIVTAVVLYFRGYRPFNDFWWSKPNKWVGRYEDWYDLY